MIENYARLKNELLQQGYVFHSATDSEVVAHLIAEGLRRQAIDLQDTSVEPYLAAVKWAVAQLHGTYGLAILFRDHPGLMIAARFGSPLVVGVGRGEYFLASDASPLAGYTDQIVYLADHQFAVLTRLALRSSIESQDLYPRTSKPSNTIRPWSASKVSTTTCSRRSMSSQSR